MKVGLLLGTLNSGGAEKMMLHLMKGLMGRGISVTLCLVNKTGPFIHDIPETADVVDLKASYGVKSVLPKIRNFVTRVRPDVVLSTQPHANAALSVSTIGLIKKPRIILREANTPSSRHADFSRMERFFYKQAHRFADHYVAVSEGVREDMISFYGLREASVTRIYNPVVDEGLLEMSREPVHHPWFMNSDIPVITAMGRVTPQKDYNTLIMAFSRVRKDRRARLFIMGDTTADPGYFREIEKLADELGVLPDIEFAGFRPNPFAYLSRASLFVLSSLYEGLPGALIQALACGCPVVSTDCPSGPAEILHNGRYGKLTRVGDSDQLAEAMIESLDSPGDRSMLAARGREFSVDRATDQYIKLMQKLTEKPEKGWPKS